MASVPGTIWIIALTAFSVDRLRWIAVFTCASIAKTSLTVPLTFHGPLLRPHRRPRHRLRRLRSSLQSRLRAATLGTHRAVKSVALKSNPPSRLGSLVPCAALGQPARTTAKVAFMNIGIACCSLPADASRAGRMAMSARPGPRATTAAATATTGVYSTFLLSAESRRGSYIKYSWEWASRCSVASY